MLKEGTVDHLILAKVPAECSQCSKGVREELPKRALSAQISEEKMNPWS